MNAPLPLRPLPTEPADAAGAEDAAAEVPIGEFVALAQRALAAEDDERERRACEDELLRRVPSLHAAGVFEVFEIRHPALRAMIADCAGAVALSRQDGQLRR